MWSYMYRCSCLVIVNKIILLSTTSILSKAVHTQRGTYTQRDTVTDTHIPVTGEVTIDVSDCM